MGQRPVALVTGAAGAIGRATTRAFVEAGHHVVGIDRDASVLTALSDYYTGFQLDLEDPSASVEVANAVDAAGQLAHVINIAGGALPEEPRTADDPLALSLAAFRASIDANLVTQFLVFQATLPALRRSSDSNRSVIFTSSFNALAGYGMPAYSAAKAGLIGLMHGLVRPLGAEGIRVSVVAPGTVRTPRTELIWAHSPGHFERLEAGAALGRLGTPTDIGSAYLALATLLTHVTGQVLVVDGGQMVMRS